VLEPMTLTVREAVNTGGHPSAPTFLGPAPTGFDGPLRNFVATFGGQLGGSSGTSPEPTKSAKGYRMGVLLSFSHALSVHAA
jgi:hypothetical protein